MPKSRNPAMLTRLDVLEHVARAAFLIDCSTSPVADYVEHEERWRIEFVEGTYDRLWTALSDAIGALQYGGRPRIRGMPVKQAALDLLDEHMVDEKLRNSDFVAGVASAVPSVYAIDEAVSIWRLVHNGPWITPLERAWFEVCRLAREVHNSIVPPPVPFRAGAADVIVALKVLAEGLLDVRPSPKLKAIAEDIEKLAIDHGRLPVWSVVRVARELLRALEDDAWMRGRGLGRSTLLADVLPARARERLALDGAGGVG